MSVTVEMSEVKTSEDSSEVSQLKIMAFGWGERFFVAVMLFLGVANAYAMKTNMSIAILAMVNHTFANGKNYTEVGVQDGEFKWTKSMQSYILASFFCGYLITQIPSGVLLKRFGAVTLIGYGMLSNAIFALLVPVSAREGGAVGLCVVRFIQGLGEGPIVPCTHAMLAQWIPPSEKSRVCGFVYAGAQFGTIIAMPLSGILAEYSWASIFYVFGAIEVIWCVTFIYFVYDDPTSHPNMNEEEKSYIAGSTCAPELTLSPTVPYIAIWSSLPFYAILFAHVGQNYIYETLMTEMPTYMKDVLGFSLKENALISAIPYLAMLICSIIISIIADKMDSSKKLRTTTTRKIINSIGQYSPAICLVAASYTGYSAALTVTFLSIGLGLNGAVFSGFKANHLDLSPRLAGLLMAYTNCAANLAGCLAPIVAGILTKDGSVGQWQYVFFIAAAVSIVCGTLYNIFASGVRQWWDEPDNVDHDVTTPTT